MNEVKSMRKTEQTLVEQMKISDMEINNRKELLNIDEKDVQRLVECKTIIEVNIEDIVETFYEKQTMVNEIALLIGDADTLKRLHYALRGYVLDLFSGYYDTEYVNNRLRIGMVHKRIGVEPKLYLFAVKTLKNILNQILKESIEDETERINALGALDKLIYFDTTLIFDTYIESLVDEIRTEKQKTEQYAKSLEAKVAERTKQLEALSRIDPLTNLNNQRAMYDTLRKEILNAKRDKTTLSLCPAKSFQLRA